MKTTVLVLVSLLVVGVGYGYRDTILDEYVLFLGGGTEYSEGYSEQLFDEIQIGDSLQKIVETLGAPLEESRFQNENGDTVTSFEYSLSAADSHYRLRIIFFIDDRVSGKVKEIHFD